MKVEDIHIGQTVQWTSPEVKIEKVPLARVIGIKEKFSRSPGLRLVDVNLLFDTPLFPEPIVDKTYELWVCPEHLTLVAEEPWTGRKDDA